MILIRANPLLGPLEGVGLENLLSNINSRYINSNITIIYSTYSIFFMYSFAMRLLIPKFVTVPIVHFSDFHICSRKFEELAKTNFFYCCTVYPLFIIFFIDFCFWLLLILAFPWPFRCPVLLGDNWFISHHSASTNGLSSSWLFSSSTVRWDKNSSLRRIKFTVCPETSTKNAVQDFYLWLLSFLTVRGDLFSSTLQVHCVAQW